MLFFSKISQILSEFAEFSPNLTKFFRDFSKMQHFSEIPNYPAPIPPPIRNRRSFARFWSRSVYCHLASSSARPQAAALRDRSQRRSRTSSTTISSVTSSFSAASSAAAVSAAFFFLSRKLMCVSQTRVLIRMRAYVRFTF